MHLKWKGRILPLAIFLRQQKLLLDQLAHHVTWEQIGEDTMYLYGEPKQLM